jgi:hypothetical protein
MEEGKIRELSKEEMKSWKGPVHYITVFPVIKLESESTKTRVVSNAAMKNVNCKLSLNDCMWTGPNALSSLLDFLIHWRILEKVIMFDLTRAYKAVHTRDLKLHVQRFLWRSSSEDTWITMTYTRATFGDVAAGLLLEVAKKKVAELGRDIDPMAADQLRDTTYVDDVMAGGSMEDMTRMKGDQVDGEWTGTLPKILKKGGMAVKFMVISGDSSPGDAKALSGAVLGIPYILETDTINYVLKMEMPVSSEASALGSAITKERIKNMETGLEVLSRRKILSHIMAELDPLGQISPLSVLSKLMLRELYGKEANLGWDSAISKEITHLWVKRFRDLNGEGATVYPRSTRPEGAVGVPDLVGFAYSSFLALCVVLYVVWQKYNGTFEARLLMAKCRVSPLHGTSIPRGELQAFVILLRLLVTAASAIRIRPKFITAFSDSECTLAAL